MPKQKLTDGWIKSKSVDKTTWYSDTDARGLQLCVTANGVKTWYVNKWDPTAQKTRRVKLGPFADKKYHTRWARTQAGSKAADIVAGDVKTKAEQELSGDLPTFGDAFEMLITHRTSQRASRREPMTEKTARDYRNSFKNHLAQWGHISCDQLPFKQMNVYLAAAAAESQHEVQSERVADWTIASFATNPPCTLSEIQELLEYVDPDAGGYDQWCSVLMALHNHTAGSEGALALADQWSRRGGKYKPGEVPAKWKSFQVGGGVGVGTIAALARENGADLSAIARKHKSEAVWLPPVPQAPLDWPEPDATFLRPEKPLAPPLPLADVFGPHFIAWAKGAAEAKGAPVDYAVLSVLSVLSSVIGNTRWVSPWGGWTEPPVIWAMLIGLPSAGKSPAIDAVLKPLRDAERPLREAAKMEHQDWDEQAAVAKLVEQTWKEGVKAALKEGEPPPERPKEADAGPEPHIPRLVVNDVTIERLGAILAAQPRGILQMRDELAGWLEGMSRYSGGGTDRPFWLEAYGGRGYIVERMGREPISIDNLTIAVMGGVQPDRLKTLLLKSDDDGLLARFLPIWPEPAPIKRPGTWAEEGLMQQVIEQLLSLKMVTDEADQHRPRVIGFQEETQNLMCEFQHAVREWETDAEGLLLSFVGKLPGLAARLSLILAYLDWAAEGADEPQEISVEHFGRAAHLIESYLLPMARRAYADASISKTERAARQLVSIIRDQKWTEFSSRDVQRMGRSGLSKKATLDPALELLIEADVLRELSAAPTSKGGRPSRRFAVNPAAREGAP